jgi:branched-chain amino acid transport system permease protein
MSISKSRYGRLALGVAAVALIVYLFLLPTFEGTKDSRLFTLTLMLTSIGVAINWNLTGGFTGYVDFGHAVWFGIGAYVTAILMSRQSDLVPQEWPLVPALVIGAAVSALIANLVGRLTLRLSGAYFSIAMLGFFVFMREVVRILRPLTNGGTGLTLPPARNVPLWFYVELILVLLLVGFSWWLRRTQFGASLLAIREDETGAETRGINTTRNKVWVFTFSAFSTGLFGSMWAYQNTALEPDTAFVEVRTIDAIMGTMLGGIGTVIGPVVGMGLLFWLREVVWANFLDYHLLVQAFLLGFIVLYLPRGVVGLFTNRGISINDLFTRNKDPERSRTSAFDGMESALDDSGELRSETLEAQPGESVTEVVNP